MNPNHISILRVYTRQKGELAADPTIDHTKDSELVVEWEAGGAANAAYGPPGSLELEVRTFDLNAAGIDTSLQPTILAVGTFVVPQQTEGEHRNYVTEYPQLIPAASPNVLAGHMYESIARISAPHAPPGQPKVIVAFARWMWYVY